MLNYGNLEIITKEIDMELMKMGMWTVQKYFIQEKQDEEKYFLIDELFSLIDYFGFGDQVHTLLKYGEVEQRQKSAEDAKIPLRKLYQTLAKIERDRLINVCLILGNSILPHKPARYINKEFILETPEMLKEELEYLKGRKLTDIIKEGNYDEWRAKFGDYAYHIDVTEAVREDWKESRYMYAQEMI